MYPTHQPDVNEVHLLQKRLQQSHHRLFTHPSLTSVSSSALVEKVAPPETPNSVLNALFNDVLKRELNIDPEDANAHENCNTYIEQARAVTQRPSLSAPTLVNSLSTGHPSSILVDKSVIRPIAPNPIKPVNKFPSALVAHSLLQRRRKEELEKQLKEQKEREEEEKKKRMQIEQENHKKFLQQLQSSDNLSTLSDDDGPIRRTRSATRRANNNNSSNMNHTSTTSMPTCCFCPSFENQQAPSRITKKLPLLNMTNDENITVSTAMKSTELIGPFVNPKSSLRNGLFVHYECACWAPQVFTDVKTNQLRRIYEEYCRGRQLRCSNCGEKGATVGCYVLRCKQVFHFRCLDEAKARRIEKYFVAFCSKHKHLADIKSYQRLMHAAIEADLASANRHSDDLTTGLDAPHSTFTKLRRSEQEIIFSKYAKLTTVQSIFESKFSIFSHKKRCTIRSKQEYLKVTDGIKLIRVSALDVAAGKLACMAINSQNNSTEEVSAIHARAAIASRDTIRIFLLRNLTKAPIWKKHQIKLIRRTLKGSLPGQKDKGDVEIKEVASKEVTDQFEKRSTEKIGETDGPVVTPATSQTRRDLDPSFFEGRYDGSGTPLLIVTPPKANEMVAGGSEVNEATKESESSTRAAEAPTLDKTISDKNDKDGANENSDKKKETDQTEENPNSSDGENPKNPKRRGRPQRRRRIQACEPSNDVTKEPNEEKEESSRPLPKSVNTPLLKFLKRSASISDSASEGNNSQSGKENVPKSGQEQSSCHVNKNRNVNVGLTGKVKSAWETFLDEHFPTERALRPDDSIEDALRNMSRRWTLLTIYEREEYEKRAQRIAEQLPDENNRPHAICLDLQQYLEKSRRKVKHGVSHVSAREAGLFANGRLSKAKNGKQSGGSSYGKFGGNTAASSKRRSSVSLPQRRIGKRKLEDTPEKKEDELLDLDAIFPSVDLSGLESDAEDEDEGYAPVRTPPQRRRRRD